jgi:Protein of unknown function (DUF3093)
VSTDREDRHERRYQERLRVPVSWWLLGVLFVGAVWLAYQHAYGPRVSVPAGLAALAAVTALLIGYGRVRVAVEDDAFVAGRARLPMWAVGDVTALDRDRARGARGAESDRRAYFLVRAYAPGAVRVTVDDPDDPVPYWYVSTRHPQQLAAALTAARNGAAD